jgi:hypothetical protein
MYEFTIPGISHGAGQQALIGAVLALDDNATLAFDMDAHKVSVISRADLADIRAAILASGHRVEKISEQADSGHSAPGHSCDMCD